MTRRVLLAALLVIALAPTFLAAFNNDQPAPELGHAPPTHPVGLEPFDNVPTMAPGTKVRATSAGTAKRVVLSTSGSVWDAIAACESGGRWDIYNPPYEGGVQFHHGTWDAYAPAGFPPDAHLASRDQQIVVAELVLAAQGWGAWPVCSRKVGLR